MSKQPTYAFNGVFIPANIWTHPQLSWLDKFIWAIVANLHDGSQICTATDAEIADVVGENEILVTQSIVRLVDLQLLNSTIHPDGSRQLWRVWVEFIKVEVKEEEAAQASTADVQRIVDIYNECCKALPRAEKLTPSRLRRIRALLKDNDEEYFKYLFLRVQASDFLSGRSGRWTGCNMDWILAPANIPRITEGIYDNRNPAQQSRPLPENLR